MTIVTLRNDFHNRTVDLRCEVLSHHGEVTIRPSSRQIQRAKRELCGVPGCTCSDESGCRGPQVHNGDRLIVDMSAIFG